MSTITSIIEAQAEMAEALEKLAAVRDYVSWQVRAAQDSEEDPVALRDVDLRVQLAVSPSDTRGSR